MKKIDAALKHERRIRTLLASYSSRFSKYTGAYFDIPDHDATIVPRNLERAAFDNLAPL